VIGRNDAEFEGTVLPKFRAVLGGFRVRVMLVRSLAGQLQIHRFDREQGRPPSPMFTSEEDAFRFLVEGR
jgi:hypothetical protein